MLEPVHEELPRPWHKLLADGVYLSNKLWLLAKVSSAHLVFHAISLPMNETGFDVSDIHGVIHRQRTVYNDFSLPSIYVFLCWKRGKFKMPGIIRQDHVRLEAILEISLFS